ncbi:hypothetical protein I3843_06G134600 [Carya illinoinensis]|uniref:uncharacterized protein LOC122312462 n=1 Tax=Carya illinoinensis TaxID=32201 RepID=UPI001C728D08|nr:uncharacterized protein LOC122312462 [Carya illinoinensis]KAG7976143.1 hypothetical protein I3843_06G134600 [Carya illinoinensis]
MAIIIIAPARFCRQEFHLFLLTQELQGRLRHHDHDLTILIILLILPIQSQVVLLERRLLKGDSLPPALATPAANKISERKCMRGPSIGSTNTNRNVIGSMISSGHKVDTPIKAGPNWASKNGSQTGAIRPAT